jgi:hypothetical protein
LGRDRLYWLKLFLVKLDSEKRFTQRRRGAKDAEREEGFKRRDSRRERGERRGDLGAPIISTAWSGADE